MRLLLGLTYYRPYTSGLTIYAERLAKGLVANGHQVTVLCSQHEAALPLREMLDGVSVVRAPVAARISKGVVMPGLFGLAGRLLRHHDALNLHLPQFDTPALALRGALSRKPVVLTYHCDVILPAGLVNRAAEAAVHAAGHIGAALASRIVTYTQDYADHSAFLRRHRDKVRIIAPPVEVAASSPESVAAFAAKWGMGVPAIGMVTRLASEKGAEVLLDALPAILAAHPTAKVFFAGTYKNVLGEQAYARRLQPRFEQFRDHWVFLGNLSQRELADFYPNCSTIVVPSLNSTEAFGLVQIEAMLCGTPSIASALPGVRQPVLTTGMGKVVPIGDSSALADAVIEVIGDRARFQRPKDEIAKRFDPRRTVEDYESLFAELGAGRA